MYINDGIVASKTEEQCLLDKEVVTTDLERAGFVFNVQKSHLDPHQLDKWLASITEEKLERFH